MLCLYGYIEAKPPANAITVDRKIQRFVAYIGCGSTPKTTFPSPRKTPESKSRSDSSLRNSRPEHGHVIARYDIERVEILVDNVASERLAELAADAQP